jgi:hypothetical protein
MWSRLLAFSKCKSSRIIAIALLVYTGGYCYFFVNDGFTLSGISSEYSYDPRYDTRKLAPSEELLLGDILNQEYTYLGHGAQFYAFLSVSGDHVLKFFRYKRLRHKPWLDYFDFIPIIDRYRLGKIKDRRKKREHVFASCKIAFDHLQNESGLVYVHLNKTKNLYPAITLNDKMGRKHRIELDDMEFLLQKKAQLLGPYIEQLMALGNIDGARKLISDLIAMISSECTKGLADDDVTILKNTGVVDGKPIHIDIGLFKYNEDFKQPEARKRKLLNNTRKFNQWLKIQYPTLSEHLESELKHYTEIEKGAGC